MKDRIRRWIFNRIGYPTDVENLLNYIDTFEGNICIYPGGEFYFAVKATNDRSEDQVLTFPTPQERAAFGAGLSHGIKIMGGSSQFLMNQDVKEFEEMEDLASFNGDPKKVH